MKSENKPGEICNNNNICVYSRGVEWRRRRRKKLFVVMYIVRALRWHLKYQRKINVPHVFSAVTLKRKKKKPTKLTHKTQINNNNNNKWISRDHWVRAYFNMAYLGTFIDTHKTKHAVRASNFTLCQFNCKSVVSRYGSICIHKFRWFFFFFWVFD